MKFEKEFRKAFPETVGETDRAFDESNYTDFLESLVEAQNTIDNKTQPEISSNSVCDYCTNDDCGGCCSGSPAMFKGRKVRTCS